MLEKFGGGLTTVIFNFDWILPFSFLRVNALKDVRPRKMGNPSQAVLSCHRPSVQGPGPAHFFAFSVGLEEHGKRCLETGRRTCRQRAPLSEHLPRFQAAGKSFAGLVPHFESTFERSSCWARLLIWREASLYSVKAELAGNPQQAWAGRALSASRLEELQMLEPVLSEIQAGADEKTPLEIKAGFAKGDPEFLDASSRTSSELQAARGG